MWVDECFFWYRLTRVVLDKIHRALQWLCVHACMRACMCMCMNAVWPKKIYCKLASNWSTELWICVFFSLLRSCAQFATEIFSNRNLRVSPDDVVIHLRWTSQSVATLHFSLNAYTYCAACFKPVAQHALCATVHLPIQSPSLLLLWSGVSIVRFLYIDGNLCNAHVRNFLGNLAMKGFSKSAYICGSSD